MLKDSVLKLYFYGKEEEIKMIIGVSENYSLATIQRKINEMTEEQQRDIDEYLKKIDIIK